MKNAVLALDAVESRIFTLRDHRVMLDAHLAGLYGVQTRELIQAVKRNIDRFPNDFMFQINEMEYDILRSQIVISNHGGRRYLPYVFTEQGVSMLSSVLRSPRAVQVNIGIMRAFVKMREAMIAHKELSRRLDEMERKYDSQFRAVFDAIRQLMTPPPAPLKPPIGFVRDKE